MERTLAEWLVHIEGLHPKGQGGIELGLERVARVKSALGQSQHCPVVIVGGTNGKGSTCAYLEAIYAAAGYRVGCYTSPHLLVYNERVRVAAAPVEDAALCTAFARVDAACQQAGGVVLTYFEFGTLAAWEVFAAAQVDVAILEVGLGGRLDAVNIYDADCAVVTGIALDHTDWLGDSRETIAFEKAGIFRSGLPAICADPEPPVTLLNHAQGIGAPLFLIGRDFDAEPVAGSAEGGWRWRGPQGVCAEVLPAPAFLGHWQQRNAAAVRLVVDCLKHRLPVTHAALCAGLRGPQLVGRFQVLPGRPSIVLDVAHNPQAAAGLAANLAAQAAASATGFACTWAVVGMLADKDIDGALAALAGGVDVWLLADLDVPRGAPAARLASAIRATGLGGRIECCASPAEALARAAKQAGENDRILVCGSFYTVAAALRELGRAPS